MGTSESIVKALTTGQQMNQRHKELQKKKFTALKALHQCSLWAFGSEFMPPN